MATDLQKRFNKLKMDLLTKKKFAFLSSVFFSLNFHWDESVDTACVNDLDMYVNPDFFESLDYNVQLFVLLHETWHVAFKHVVRFKEIPNGQHLLYNYAADYVINDTLYLDGVKLWDQCLHDPQYRHWSTDQVYVHLKKDPPPELDEKHGDLRENPSGKGGAGSQEKMPGMPKKSNKEIESKIDEVILKAAMQAEMAKSPGSIPGEIQIYIEELKNPKLDWTLLLQRFLNDFIKTDYSWSRPNRRYMPEFYLPTMHNPGMLHLAVAWDLSGSTSDDNVNTMMTEVAEARRMLQPVTTTVLTFDTDIKQVTELSVHQPITDVQLAGRGGTDFEPVIKYFMDNRPNLLIIFTDMGADPITTIPDFPILWIAIDAWEHAPKQPVGEVIEYISED